MPPGPSLSATQDDGRWWLDGTKQYCSGARVCTNVLVTAQTPAGVRLFAADTAPTACGRCRGPGPRWAWRAATPWTSGSAGSGRAGRATGRLREPARFHPRRRRGGRLLVRRGPRGGPAAAGRRPAARHRAARIRPPGRGRHRPAQRLGRAGPGRRRDRQRPAGPQGRRGPARAAGPDADRSGGDRGAGAGGTRARSRAAGARRRPCPAGGRPHRVPAAAPRRTRSGATGTPGGRGGGGW